MSTAARLNAEPAIKIRNDHALHQVLNKRVKPSLTLSQRLVLFVDLREHVVEGIREQPSSSSPSLLARTE